jgi:hypothetical protein
MMTRDGGREMTRDGGREMTRDGGRAVSSSTVTAPPQRRRAGRRILFALVVLVLLVAAAVAVTLAASEPWRWSARAAMRPVSDNLAWQSLPGDMPVFAVLDVPSLMSSPIARSVRPEIDAQARRWGFDLPLAEENAKQLALVSDGRGFATGIATGVKLSPLLLPRFDPRWHRVSLGSRTAITDGSAVIAPLDPGAVAYSVSEAGQDSSIALTASLTRAGRSPSTPVDLAGASLLIRVRFDDVLKRRIAMSVPRQAAIYVAGIDSLEARATAGQTLDATVRLTMQTEDAAAATTAALSQLHRLLASGLGAFLAPFMGENAGLVSKIPPFDATRDGKDVVVTTSATAEQLRELLAAVPQPR